jgi:hypothetical protein
MKTTTTAVVATLLGAAQAWSADNGSLPIVDLGYEIHQASTFNVSCDLLYWTVCMLERC